MKTIFKHLLAISTMATALAAHADDKGHLYIIGEATPYGWSLDHAQSLLPSVEEPSVFTGTIYLKGGDGSTFKFMEDHEWGNPEYGVASDEEACVGNGQFQVATGSLDNGYKQMYVAQSGNYDITIDTKNLTASISRSDYQDSEINYISLFMVGNATAGGWSIEDGTPLGQSTAAPYEYSAIASLKATDNGNIASFKIVKSLSGGGSWDGQYFFFRDGADSGKISTDSTDDRQWSVAEDGDYSVTVNTLTNAITIEKYDGDTSAIDEISINSTGETSSAYYNLQGQKVDNPRGGIFIKVTGEDVEKVILH